MNRIRNVTWWSESTTCLPLLFEKDSGTEVHARDLFSVHALALSLPFEHIIWRYQEQCSADDSVSKRWRYRIAEFHCRCVRPRTKKNQRRTSFWNGYLRRARCILMPTIGRRVGWTRLLWTWKRRMPSRAIYDGAVTDYCHRIGRSRATGDSWLIHCAAYHGERHRKSASLYVSDGFEHNIHEAFIPISCDGKLSPLIRVRPAMNSPWCDYQTKFCAWCITVCRIDFEQAPKGKWNRPCCRWHRLQRFYDTLLRLRPQRGDIPIATGDILKGMFLDRRGSLSQRRSYVEYIRKEQE